MRYVIFMCCFVSFSLCDNHYVLLPSPLMVKQMFILYTIPLICSDVQAFAKLFSNFSVMAKCCYTNFALREGGVGEGRGEHTALS
jgi:hypothetical protein